MRCLLVLIFAPLFSLSQSVVDYTNYVLLYGAVTQDGIYRNEKRIDIAGLDQSSHYFILNEGYRLVDYKVYSGEMVDMLPGFDTNGHLFEARIISLFPKPYANLTTELNSNVIIVSDNVLKFSYTEKFRPLQNKEVKITGQTNSYNYNIGNIEIGLNFFIINVSTLPSNEYYLVEMLGSEGQKYYLRFLKRNL